MEEQSLGTSHLVDENANAICFLCSDLASYITGVALNVSGGVELFVF